MNNKKENMFLTKIKIYLGVGVGAYLLSTPLPTGSLVLRSSDNLLSQTNSNQAKQTLIHTEDSSQASRRGGGGESGESGESGERRKG